MSFWNDATYAAFWLDLARGDLATWIQLTPYVYAALEGAHLIGVAFFFGSIFLLDLQLVGLTAQLPAGPTGRFLLRICAPAFVLVTLSGVLLFVPHADRYAVSPVFFVKMSAMVAGGLNALAFHARRAPRWTARTTAVVSVLVWLSVLALGRWMGYERREPPEFDLDLLPFAAAAPSVPPDVANTRTELPRGEVSMRAVDV